MRKRKQKPEFEPAEGEEIVRYFHDKEWGSLPVVKRTVEKVVGKRQATDENGKPLFRKTSRDGQYTVPVMENVVQIEEKEFLWRPINSVHANYVEHFEPSPETILAAKRRARKAELLDEMLEQMLDKEFGSDDTEEGVEYPRHVGGPYYELSDGTKVKGKQEALEREQELGGG